MEHKFDSFFKDFSLNHDVKTTDCKEPISEIEEADYKFAREDLEQLSEAVSLDPLSVYTVKDNSSDKESESEEEKKACPVSPVEHTTKSSPFWKRVDMRQKKIIRGLSGLVRDYFKNLVPAKMKKEMFQVWDEFLQSHFPAVYEKSRLSLLGQISVMCLSWKFPEKIRACHLFNDEEKESIIKHGTEFRNQRN